MRDFFTVFFALVFPSLMLLIFGSIYGEYPSPQGGTMLDSITPAYSCMVMGVTGLLSFPMTVASNMDRGVYVRFDASPVGKTRMIWGELTANLLLTFLGLAILFTFAWAVFGVLPKGSWLALAGAVVLCTVSMLSMGFFLIAVCPGSRSALALCYTVYFVMLFLSGATLPRLLFNETLLAVSNWIPMTYAVQLMQGAFIGFSGLPAAELLVVGSTAVGCGVGGTLLFRIRS